MAMYLLNKEDLLTHGKALVLQAIDKHYAKVEGETAEQLFEYQVDGVNEMQFVDFAEYIGSIVNTLVKSIEIELRKKDDGRIRKTIESVYYNYAMMRRAR